MRDPLYTTTGPDLTPEDIEYVVLVSERMGLRLDIPTPRQLRRAERRRAWAVGVMRRNAALAEIGRTD